MSTDDPITAPLPGWTIFDWLKTDAKKGTAAWSFQHDVSLMVDTLRRNGEGALDNVARRFSLGSKTLETAIANLRKVGIEPWAGLVSGYVSMFTYLALAMDRGYQIWALTDNAVGELFSTRIPDNIYRERLPSMPSESILVMAPRGSLLEAMQHELDRRDVEAFTMIEQEAFLAKTATGAQAVLVHELVPNRAWRGVVMTNAKDGPDTVGSYFFSVDVSLPKSLEIFNGPLGHLLLNLFLCYENRETIEVPVTPHFPGKPGGKKNMRARRQKSGEPYVLIDITEPEKTHKSDPEDRDGGSMSDRSPRGHWVKAHWHHYWMRKPDRPAEDERLNEHGNTLYLVKKRIGRYWAGPEKDRGGVQRRVNVTAQPGRGLAWDL